MALDAKYTGDWRVMEDGTSIKRDTILRITQKGFDLTYGTNQVFSQIALNGDGTVTATMPLGSIVFEDADHAVITTSKPQRLEKVSGPGPGSGSGSGSSDTSMALILGLVIVGLFALNDIF